MSHYFTNDDNLKSNPRIISHEFNGKIFEFHTDSGVFSPEKVDYATDLLMQNIESSAGKLLDLACGYGPIGIILGKTFGCNITMSDVNRRALELAKMNREMNGVNAKIIESNGLANIDGEFDIITLNPPIHAGKDVCYKMYEGAAQHLTFDGKFYIVIQKKHGANSTITKLCEIYKSVETIYKKKGYYILRCSN